MSIDFNKRLFDSCMHYKWCGSVYVFLLLYVDDILLMSPDFNVLNSVKLDLIKEFDMKDLGCPSKILGISIIRKRKENYLVVD